MGFFKSLTQAALNLIVTPIEVVKDVATLGGVLTDQGKPYTLQRLEKAQDKLNEALED